MWLALGKVLFAAVIISFVSWLSAKKTGLAGFLTALPLMSMLALAFSYGEWGNERQAVEYAKSILWAIPFSLLFFVPFLLAEQLHLGFWSCYLSGTSLIVLGYFAHSYLTGL